MKVLGGGRGGREPGDPEEALGRILDATIKAGGAHIGDDIDYAMMWDRIDYVCTYWLEHATMFASFRKQNEGSKSKKRQIKALQAYLQEDPAIYPSGRPGSVFARLVQRHLDELLSARPDKDEIKEFDGPGSLLARLVGGLALIYEKWFGERPGYTTADGETDGPFIRFVEQTLHEFCITKDGNQPYMRSSIADALTEFKRVGGWPPGDKDYAFEHHIQGAGETVEPSAYDYCRDMFGPVIEMLGLVERKKTNFKKDSPL